MGVGRTSPMGYGQQSEGVTSPTMAVLFPITNATADEEARWLKLADVALGPLGQTALQPSTPTTVDRTGMDVYSVRPL